jgi:sugar phosphate isomerase/epimerase
MSAPIGLQLYTVREAMNQDFRLTIKRVAETGYIGVETAGFPGITPKEAAKLFNTLGLTVCGAHNPMPIGEKKNEVVEIMGILGNPPLIVPWQPPELFESMEGLKKLAGDLNAANEIGKENGFKLGYHNHHAEMHLLDGEPALLQLSKLVEPGIFFEIDTYWVKTGGIDPVKLIRILGPKAPYLHIKDGPCVRGEPMVAVGEGSMDFKPIIEAGEKFTEWLIVELDACATDMFDAAVKSYTYLTQKGLANGRK